MTIPWPYTARASWTAPIVLWWEGKPSVLVRDGRPNKMVAHFDPTIQKPNSGKGWNLGRKGKVP